MNEPISVGDLVQVVRWPCCGRGNLGMIFTVGVIDNNLFRCTPDGCGKEHKGPNAALRGKIAAPLAWLKRIPPLSELEGEKRDEEITA
jgi:hypothetical protein